MTAIRLEWDVPNIDALLAAGFDYLKVERGPGWVEITRPHLRIPLVATMQRYCYHDPSGTVDGDFAITSTYQAVPWRSSDDALDSAIPITDVEIAVYCTIAEVRDEGYTLPTWTDAKIMCGIRSATELINKVTTLWFEPRFRHLIFDGPAIDQLFLDIPIVAIMKIEQDEIGIDLADFKVYNRHLTQGQLNPDDRMDPRIGFARDWEPGYRDTHSIINSRFGKGRKIIRLTGVFGWTSLSDGDMPGETAVDSQIPLSLGQTPGLIRRAAILLAIRMMQPASMHATQALLARRTAVKTRDQSVSYAAPSESSEVSDFGLTGVLEVDNILMDFPAPLKVGAV